MAAPAESNFQIRVFLLDSEPLIWRRARLSGETTLEELHRVIQVVMDWENYHMHRFVASDRVYGVDEDFIPDPQSERSVTLREVIPQPQDHLLYEYDFGDGWEHEILVEELLAPEDKRVHLSKIGNIAFRYWDDIPNQSASVGLDAFVIMPNHLHGIAIIKALDGPRRDVGRSSPNPL